MKTKFFLTILMLFSLGVNSKDIVSTEKKRKEGIKTNLLFEGKTNHDAEVIIAPITNAIPGSNAMYNLVWRNKGNTTLSGKVILNYDSDKMVFKSSSLPYATISDGSIEFDYSDLEPLENTSVELNFKLNTSTNINPEDQLVFNTQITPYNTDINPEDNLFNLNQKINTTFGSNHIICLEGETLPITDVGEYIHYIINFENAESSEVENILVKMDVDPNKLDINTLQLINASAEVDTQIIGNNIQFIFNRIRLKSGGHGSVVLKIKTKSDLKAGDVIDNIAEVYFDNNLPLQTNQYITTIYDANTVLKAKINYTISNFSQNNYPINFDAGLSTGNIVSYLWEFSGNPTITSNTSITPLVTYSTNGNYTAKLTVFDAKNAFSTQTISFEVGANTANLSTGKDNNNNFINIDTNEDDWKGYLPNGTEIKPKVRHTYSGWSYADIGNGRGSQWITLNTLEGYYTYKSVDFTIPENATDARMNLRSLSFDRSWTYLVKINLDGTETETLITKTQWLNDGFKGWLNSRSPKVENYELNPGKYYIKIVSFSNNNSVRQALDVNTMITCSTGLLFITNKNIERSSNMDFEVDEKNSEVQIYPIPTKDHINILAEEGIIAFELYDSVGKLVQKQFYDSSAKKVQFNLLHPKGIYYLKIKTAKGTLERKIIKE